MAKSEAKEMAAEVISALRSGPVHKAVMDALANGATSVEVVSEAAAELYVSVMADELHKLGVWIYSFTETYTERRGSSTGYDSDGELVTTRIPTIHLRPIKKPQT